MDLGPHGCGAKLHRTAGPMKHDNAGKTLRLTHTTSK
jgi:hypothetical protein